MRLTWRHSEADRETFGIRPSMELGREAAARTAETVAMSPPLPPAAWWCARTMVESIICIMLSEARRLKALEDENTKLKKLLADAMLDNVALKDLLSKKF